MPMWCNADCYSHIAGGMSRCILTSWLDLLFSCPIANRHQDMLASYSNSLEPYIHNMSEVIPSMYKILNSLQKQTVTQHTACANLKWFAIFNLILILALYIFILWESFPKCHSLSQIETQMKTTNFERSWGLSRKTHNFTEIGCQPQLCPPLNIDWNVPLEPAG